jgi:hypothetical protein
VVIMLPSDTQDRGFAPGRSRRIFSVEKIYIMGCLEGSGVPVVYIGRTVRKG